MKPLFDAIRGLWRAPMEPVTGHLADGDDIDPMVDSQGWLVGRGVTRLPSVRHSPLTTRGPIAILWHYTATEPGTARSLARRIRTYREGKDRAASWHVLVGQNGHLWQSVPFLRGAWHCRRGTVVAQYWQGDTQYWVSDFPSPIERHRVNACSIGIELEGHGVSWPWEQVAGATRLVRALVDAYPIHPHNAMLGHSEFDPARRIDPGQEWMALLPKLLRSAYGADLP